MPQTSLDAAVVTRRNLRDQLLAEYPSLAEDSEALLDTLSGIDDLEEQCLAVLRHALEREAYGKALAGMMDEMTARKRRLEDGAKTLRLAVLQAMQEAGLPRIKAADMTVTIGRSTKPKVLITEADAIPEHYCRIRRDPDKTAIAAALEVGQIVPGAALGNHEPFLSVRTK